MTKEQVITRIKHNSMYRDDRETADYIIKALEQQPSDDCVSRQAVNEYLENLLDGRFDDFISAAIIGIKDNINAMPPVTPTHGTCDDCHYSKEKNNFQICTKYHEIVKRHGFYCADFEKRGNEND